MFCYVLCITVLAVQGKYAEVSNAASKRLMTGIFLSFNGVEEWKFIVKFKCCGRIKLT
jgi:hypothetical protein